MSDSFVFYDLETTGISSSKDRILQFAAQRTDMNLNLVGEPIDIKIELAEDILPSPEACLVNRIDPTKMEGAINEAQFAKIFNEEIATKGTIFAGFNNLRFDDNFIRFLNYRNFYDPYRWHWENGRSRWDIIDLVRMTRALRPEGMNWPVGDDGKQTIKLEKLTKENNLTHDNAHDAVSDVLATIDVAKLIKENQPKLFNYFLNIRNKDEVIRLLNTNKTLVYSSAKYSTEFLNTTLVYVLDVDLTTTSSKVFDLRSDPKELLELTAEELAEKWRYNPENRVSLLPIKTIKLNRCPAIASATTIKDEGYDRIKLDKEIVEKNIEFIDDNIDVIKEKVIAATKILNEIDEKRFEEKVKYPDETLFDGFTSNADAIKFPNARKLEDIIFSTTNLNNLYKLYRARNYPNSDTESDKYLKEIIKQKLVDSGALNHYIKNLIEKINTEEDQNNKDILESLLNRAKRY